MIECPHMLDPQDCTICNPKFEGAEMRHCEKCAAETWHFPSGKCVRCDEDIDEDTWHILNR